MTVRFFTSLLALFLFFEPAYAFRSRFIVPDNPTEDAFLSNFNSLSLVEAALAASGVPEADMPRYAAQFKRWESEIRSGLPRGASQNLIAEHILTYIHTKVFSRYRVDSTTLAEVFRDGSFNCVSSTIVNGLLLQAFGIEVKGVTLPTHIYLVAVLDGKPVEIENTIAQGLQIAQNKKLQEQFNSLTGFNYEGGSKKVVISWTEVIGVIYSNRSYFSSQRREYEKSFQNMMKAQVLLASAPNEQSNLVTGYVNYSFYVFQRENRPSSEYLHALEVLQEGISRYQSQPTLKGNYTRGVEILVYRMLTNGSSNEEVDQFLNTSQPFMISKDYEKLSKIRHPFQIAYYLNDRKDFDAAKRILLPWYRKNPEGRDEKAWARNYCLTLAQDDLKRNTQLAPNAELLDALSEFLPAVAGEIYGYYYSELANRLFKSKKIEEAVALMEDGLTTAGPQTFIIENGFAVAVNAGVYYFNQSRFESALGYYKRALAFKNTPQISRDMAAAYGNLALEAYNSQNYTLAKKWIAEGLALAPADRRLQQIQAQL